MAPIAIRKIFKDVRNVEGIGDILVGRNVDDVGIVVDFGLDVERTILASMKFNMLALEVVMLVETNHYEIANVEVEH